MQDFIHSYLSLFYLYTKDLIVTQPKCKGLKNDILILFSNRSDLSTLRKYNFKNLDFWGIKLIFRNHPR